VNHEDLVAYCLAKPGATPDEPWEGSLVVRVGRKIFAFLGSGGLGVTCGRDAHEAAELRHRYPGAASVMPCLGRHGWNTVAVDGTVPDHELLELDSYAAVVAKRPERLCPQTA
jgi:predicted DNA-binding protein (MmcQ/YjbR family)